MKYNDNGEYKDIYVKAFDTLPVGTEVDFDGSTVPQGWTQVKDKSKVLWTNSSPTSAFAGQNINIDLSNYDSYEIIYENSCSVTPVTLQSSGIIPKSAGTCLTHHNLRFLGHRTTSIISNSIYFDNYVFYGTYGDNTTQTNNNFCVPLYVIGHNTGLYS